MLELFVAMMKEEWRVHSTIFGSLSFALYPVLICATAFMGSFLLPLIRPLLPFGDLALITHALFLLLGLMIGAFGLLMNEVMERRFGEASSLAYSARALPLSERCIFAHFVAKDTLYYFVLWVLPFVMGFALAAPFVGIPPAVPALLLLTLSLSFLTGLAAAFFLSMVYTRSKRVFAAVFILLAVAAYAAHLAGLTLFLPPALFRSFSWMTLLAACTLVVVPTVLAVLLTRPESAARVKHYTDLLTPIAQRLSVFPYPVLAAKDCIDLLRSGSAVGQTLFSFLLPLGVIWFFLSLLGPFLPASGILLLFAALTGVIASTMYVWLTMFETFGQYACLPLAVADVLKSKICGFALLQVVPAVFIAAVAVLAGEAAYLLPALTLCLAVSFYGLGVTVHLTGLSPSVLLYDPRVLVLYLLAVGVPLVVFITLSFINPWYAMASLVLPAAGWGIVQRGIVKWNGREVTGF
ncbi:hypothetical protein [Methanofollis fontis]|uniref:Uncharacterized protein n=1 Tax=Methanofollis fontis TaxID=2052832 RepID=A0A483CTQ1_9EURY|nr:hypothetical protein [Methanofollis fontis]TAJ44668.1 hypothetical protein CUJ86_05010 [Methanofollis fontis]